MRRLKFYFFHLMPYGFVPPADEWESAWAEK